MSLWSSISRLDVNASTADKAQDSLKITTTRILDLLPEFPWLQPEWIYASNHTTGPTRPVVSINFLDATY
jgi:hypothetical protein